MVFWFGTIVFFTTYVLIASEKVHKTTAALVGSCLMLLVILKGPSHHEDNLPVAGPAIHNEIPAMTDAQEVLEQKMEADEESHAYRKLDVYARYVNFDVIFTLAGMMLLVNILSGTGFFQYVAIRCAKLSRGSPIRTMIFLVIATAVLSAFLDNVTTVLLIAPLTLLVAMEMGVPSIPFLMAETIASNIGGTATLIGDPPNLIIGSAAGLNFMAFLINLSPFILVILALYCFCLYAYYGKKMHITVEKRARIMELDESAAITDPDNMKRGGLVMSLTIVGFLVHGTLGLQPCVIAMCGASLALLICKVNVDHALEKIEWSTLFFFLGLFVIVNGAEKAGLMQKFGNVLSCTAEWPPLLSILLVMWISGIAAAVMNNVSFTAAMVAILSSFLTHAPAFSGNRSLQELMWWGLALAVCLGGNGTLVGAAANLVTVGIAEKGGEKISFRQFLSYGVPVTFVSLVAASIYVGLRYLMIH